MLRHERRLLLDSLRIGIALTGLVIACDLAGLLTPAENFFYDLRARLCQHFSPPPTEKLVHVDIDDTALDVIGAYPWPRRKVAMMLEEIRLAGPKAVETDVLYSEPQLVQHEPIGEGKFETIDNDAELAAAIGRLGNMIVPATLKAVEKPSPRYLVMVEELTKDVEQDESAVAVRMRDRGMDVGANGVGDQFYLARREAIARRLTAMHATPDTPFSEVRAALMPKTPVNIHPGVENVLKEQWEKFLAKQAFRERHSLAVPEGMVHLTNMQLDIPPLRQHSLAAAGGAFVDYTKFGSAVIRTLPLLLEQDGRVYPQMGLALACRMLDADMNSMRVDGETLIVPRQDGRELRIPLSPPRMSTEGHMMGSLIDIPWFGGRTWETMYDFPAHQQEKQHIPITLVWQTYKAREKILTNNKMLDDAIRGAYEAQKDADRWNKYNASIPPPEDSETRVKEARSITDGTEGFLEVFAKMKPSEMDRRDVVYLESIKALKNLTELNPILQKDLAQSRADLSERMKGKAVLIGWTATAAIADFVPTSLHEKCPGVVVHGVIFNGIMTGEMWRRSPPWVAVVIAGVMGVLTALAVGYFSPMRALGLAGIIVAAYAIVNGIVLFDYGNWIVGAAGPLTAVAVTWSGCTLARVRVEARERTRITQQFGNYSDTQLVDHILENPDFTFQGEDREVTIAFTDLAGFTSLSEKLGPKIVPLLNELLDELVPVIRDRHGGYVNKFLGDGIMIVYNAPKKIERHANSAIASVLDMQTKLIEFNARLRERGLDELAMRAGIASGTVVVGNAGGGGRNDYTALGDAVNLSARLEPANKVVGTHTLMNARAAELLDGEFLIRPVGRIQVVGQEQASMCYEPISRADAATDQQRELAAMTTMMVDAFVTRRFEDCMRFIAQLEADCGGVTKLTSIYRDMCEKYLREPPGDNFDGRIILTQK
jgi:class 3 adenylate cyclase/CHASE2 domain-containing sensor protein